MLSFSTGTNSILKYNITPSSPAAREQFLQSDNNDVYGDLQYKGGVTRSRNRIQEYAPMREELPMRWLNSSTHWEERIVRAEAHLRREEEKEKKREVEQKVMAAKYKRLRKHLEKRRREREKTTRMRKISQTRSRRLGRSGETATTGGGRRHNHRIGGTDRPSFFTTAYRSGGSISPSVSRSIRTFLSGPMIVPPHQ